MVTDTANEERATETTCILDSQEEEEVVKSVPIHVIPFITLSILEEDRTGIFLEEVQGGTRSDAVDTNLVPCESSLLHHESLDDEFRGKAVDADGCFSSCKTSNSRTPSCLQTSESDLPAPEIEHLENPETAELFSTDCSVENQGESCGVLNDCAISSFCTRPKAQAISKGRSRLQRAQLVNGDSDCNFDDSTCKPACEQACTETCVSFSADDNVLAQPCDDFASLGTAPEAKSIVLQEDATVLCDLLELQRSGMKVVLPVRVMPQVAPSPKRARTDASDEPAPVVLWEAISTDDIQDWIDLDDLGGSPCWPPGVTRITARRELQRRSFSSQ